MTIKITTPTNGGDSDSLDFGSGAQTACCSRQSQASEVS